MKPELQALDRQLIALEELLLEEMTRLRKAGSEETYSAIDPANMKLLRVEYTTLVEELEGSASWTKLSLKSFEQEWVEERMKVVRNLLQSKLPTAFLALSHEEHRQTRKSDFATDDHQASLELAILSEQVNLHHVEGQSIDQILKDRAQFTSRELSSGHAQESIREKKASSPEELRKKLAGKRGTGASSFAGRDIASLNDTVPDKGPIAKSPEEIRRKLAERQGDTGGKAVFGAKDLSSPPPPVPTAQKTEKQQPEEEKPRTGPAVFEAKDLSKRDP